MDVCNSIKGESLKIGLSLVVIFFFGESGLGINVSSLYGAEDREKIERGTAQELGVVERIPSLQAAIQVDVMENLCGIVGRPDGLQRIKTYLDVDQGNPNLCDQGDQQSLLEIFAFSGNEAMVDTLTEKGAFVPYVDSKGHHALYLASAEGYPNIVEKLLNRVKKTYGAEIAQEMLNNGDFRGITALHIASVHGHQHVIEKLLRYHANVDQADQQGRTALHVACYMGHNSVIDQLLDYGASIGRASDKGLTAKDFFKLGELQESLRRNPRTEARLMASEKEERRTQQQYIGENESLRAFMMTFQRKCGSMFLAYKALESEAIERAKDVLTVSNTMNILGNIIPLPGTALVAEVAAMAAEMVEDRIEANKKKLLTQLFTTVKEMEEAVEEGAYRLTRRYEPGIVQLTVDGATTLAESGVARFIAYMRDQQTRIEKDKPFSQYILESVQSPVISHFLSGFSLWQVRIQTQDKQLQWTDQDIFTGKLPGILEPIPPQQASSMVFEVSVTDEEECLQEKESTKIQDNKNAQKLGHAKCCVIS